MLRSHAHENSSTSIANAHAILELCFSRQSSQKQHFLYCSSCRSPDFCYRNFLLTMEMGTSSSRPSSLDPLISKVRMLYLNFPTYALLPWDKSSASSDMIYSA
ncbi:Tubby-like F-box protein 10 [Senna tora]|uniref:Tubby-like F-box protein 10 n=1 Tax=Senna tora TaxID=362788 RepID=A0A834TI48_9FABA|nr:Tubby-like F-box protein 10 [Senna tora]